MESPIPEEYIYSWRKIHGPIEDLSKKYVHNLFFVDKNIKNSLISWLKLIATHEIIHNDISSYDEIITDENRKRLMDVLNSSFSLSNEVWWHSFSDIIWKNREKLSLKWKWLLLLPIQLQSQWFQFLQWSLHQKDFYALPVEKQSSHISDMNSLVTNEASNEISLHWDLHRLLEQKEHFYAPSEEDRKKYQENIMNDVSEISSFENNLLSSVVEDSDYKLIRKPLLVEMHKDIDAWNVMWVFLKASKFMWEHWPDLVSEKNIHLSYILLHCHWFIRKVVRSIFIYYNDLHLADKLRNLSEDEKIEYYINNSDKRTLKSITNAVASVKKRYQYSSKSNRWDPYISYPFDPDTQWKDLMLLDNEEVIQNLTNHYIQQVKDDDSSLIEPYRYNWALFKFQQFRKAPSLIEKKKADLHLLKKTNFSFVYEMLQDSNIKKLYMYWVLWNSPLSKQLANKDISEYQENFKKKFRKKMKDKDLSFLEALELFTSDLWFFQLFLKESDCDSDFVRTSDIWHGLSSRSTSAEFRAKQILNATQHWKVRRVEMYDDIVILEDDNSQASKWSNSMKKYAKNCSVVTSKNAINFENELKKNQFFLLDLQQPDDEFWWYSVIQNLLNKRKMLDRKSCENVIRIHLFSKSERLFDLTLELQKLQDEWERYNVLISFGTKDWFRAESVL